MAADETRIGIVGAADARADVEVDVLAAEDLRGGYGRSAEHEGGRNCRVGKGVASAFRFSDGVARLCPPFKPYDERASCWAKARDVVPEPKPQCSAFAHPTLLYSFSSFFAFS